MKPNLLFCGLPSWLRWSRIRLQCGRPGLDPWVRTIPLEEGMATHSTAWRIRMVRGDWRATVHWVAESDTTEQLSTHSSFVKREITVSSDVSIQEGSWHVPVIPRPSRRCPASLVSVFLPSAFLLITIYTFFSCLLLFFIISFSFFIPYSKTTLKFAFSALMKMFCIGVLTGPILQLHLYYQSSFHPPPFSSQLIFAQHPLVSSACAVYMAGIRISLEWQLLESCLDKLNSCLKVSVASSHKSLFPEI